VRVRPRALLFALGFLVLLDLALRLPLALPVPHDFRLPNRTTMGYDEYVASMRRDPDTRIAVVGDSIVWGGFAEPWDTLSAHLDDVYAKQGRAVSAYNLGMNGAHANDLYPLVADLAEEKATDVVLLNFDMRFYAEPSIVRRYPELYDKAASTLASAPPDLLKLGTPKPAAKSLEQRADAAISRVWRLYAIRDYLAAALFGDRPASALNHRMNRLRADLFGPPLYGKKPPSRLPLDDIRQAFDVPELSEDTMQMRYLTATLDLAREAGIAVVVFAGPADSKLLDSLDLWDRATYEANLARVRRIVESHGGVFATYTDAVPGALIGDSHHPLGAGYKVLAEAIAKDIDPLIRRAESDRATASGGER
jgi:hypothetical protein